MLKRTNTSNEVNNTEFDNLVNSVQGLDNSDSESEEVVLKKTKKKLILLGVLAGCFIALTVAFKFSVNMNSSSSKEMESYKQAQLQEPHTSMRYFLVNERTKDTLEAAGLLIGHVMDTGCSSAYSALLEVFPDNSLEQLYSYLKGKDCSEYYRAQVVKIKDGDYYYEYLVKLDKTGKDFIVKINHDEYKVSEFNITPYIKE